MNAILIFFGSVLVARLWRGRDSMKEWLIDGAIGFGGTAIVGMVVFLIYVVLISPSHIYSEQMEQIELLTNRVGFLIRFDSNLNRQNQYVANENESLKTALILCEATNRDLSQMIVSSNTQSPILQGVQASNVTVNTDYSQSPTASIMNNSGNAAISLNSLNSPITQIYTNNVPEYLKPRTLTDHQKVQLLNAMSLLPKQTFSFAIDQSASDGKQIANDIGTVLLGCGWKYIGYSSEIGMGQGIQIAYETDATREPAEKLAETLKSFGLTVAITTKSGELMADPNSVCIIIWQK